MNVNVKRESTVEEALKYLEFKRKYPLVSRNTNRVKKFIDNFIKHKDIYNR